MRRRTFLTATLAAMAATPALAQTTTPSPAGTPAAAATPAPTPFIEPQNALERALIAATDTHAGNADRDVFRRLFLRSNVALVLSSNSPDAPPAQIEPRPGVHTCLIFTSSARVTEVMSADRPRVVLTGRQALERVRGTNVVININLRPFITLDAAGVEGFLSLPEGRQSQTPRSQQQPQTQAPESAGPSQ